MSWVDDRARLSRAVAQPPTSRATRTSGIGHTRGVRPVSASGVAALAAVLVLSACSAQGPPEATDPAPAGDTGGSGGTGPAGHSHAHAGARVSLPVGDGTRSYEVGYTLRDVRLPARAGEPGRLSFVVQDFTGRPQTDYLDEQTKKMHVYVVRSDLAVFRHVHPELQPDGTWSGTLTLPEPGDYRVVTELVARDDGGDGDHVLLGARATVPGDWQPEPVTAATGTASDWGVEATVLGDVAAGSAQELRIRLATPDGGAPQLGQYLGTYAHLTGFHVASGGVVHMHPLGAPGTGPDGAELVFHAQLPRPGEYLLFLQVPVDGFLHTLPVPVVAE